MAREAGAAVVSVDDNRGRVDLDVESIEAMSLQGLDGAIEEKLADEDFSTVALDVDQRVRKADELDTNVNRVADSFAESLHDAQGEAFDDAGPEETPDGVEQMEADE